MCGASLARQIRHQYSLLRNGKLVPRGLTDDDEVRLPLQRVRQLGAIAVAFFSNDEKESKVIDGLAAKTVSGFQHRRDDSLRVTRPTTVEILFVFANGQYGRNRVYMRA